MHRILPAREAHALHDAAASRAIEQSALAAVEPHALMRRAGIAVARLARALAPHARTVWVLCGPGNNGGDGLEAAIHLRAAGLAVSVTLTGDPSSLPADASDAFLRAQAAGVSISASSETPGEMPEIAIDALLGMGANRAPSGLMASWIGKLNALPCIRLAVDLPSGLNADTGQAHGEVCVAATHTLALLTLKPGLFTGSGRDLAGEVWLDDLGVASGAPPPTAYLNAGQGIGAASRRHASHKGSFGDVAVVGGAHGMTGAAILAARAAHAAGAGRVYVNLLDSDAMAFDPLRPEVMFRANWWQSDAALVRQTTVVCGCGGGEAVRAALPRLLSLCERLVLDADALNAIAADSSLQSLLTGRHGRRHQTILTPHPLEAARLLGLSTSAVQSDRLAATRQLAERFRSTIVLKGSGTVIADADATPIINSTGTAALASAGTGDVLAGWLAGSWSAAASTAIDAACQGVWLHGLAADHSRVMPLRAADLIDAMLNAPRR